MNEKQETDLGYTWRGPRLFDWYSKEVRVIRAFLRLSWLYEKLDHQWCTLLDIRNDTNVEMALEAYCDRKYRVKRAMNRLRDRLGFSTAAAGDAFEARYPRNPGETDGDYYTRVRGCK